MISILVISTATAVSVSFLCSLAEALLLSLNPLTLSHLQAANPRAAESWRRLKRRISHPITAILVLNTVAHTGGATVAGGAFAEIYGENRIWIFSVLFTIVILLGTEILPKVIGVTFRNQLAPYAGPILEVVTKVLYPFIVLSEILFRRLTTDRESEQITTADLITLASLARSGKTINLEQENIIVNAVRLTHTLVRQAMIAPDKIRFVRAGDSPEEVLALACGSGHTRYPVSRTDDVRDIDAYIVIKLAVSATPQDVKRLLAGAKPVHTVNQRDTLMAALRTMLEQREHLLSVVDDQKRCVGIVTMEDIAGELLNADIRDFK